MLNLCAVDYPTFPVNLRYFHLFEILAECQAILWECRAATMGRQVCGTRMVIISALFAGIESMEFIDRGAASKYRKMATEISTSKQWLRYNSYENEV